nr:ATP-binding cassette domain-containing protein [Nocardioides convexus]
MFQVAAFALVAVGLNIVIGYAGLLDLGYVGFYATGAYTTGVLTSQHGSWPFFLALPVAIAVTMVTGVILGAPTLRVRGDYLAIVTLGFGEIIRICVKNIEWLGASAGIKDIPHPNTIGPEAEPPFKPGGLFEIPRVEWNGLVPSLDFDHPTHFLVFGATNAIPYYWLILTALILVLIGDRLVKASRVGRAWEATREDEDAAEPDGRADLPVQGSWRSRWVPPSVVCPARSTPAARAATSVPTAFPLLLSMLFVAAVIVGGSGNRWGAIVGGALVAYLPERFREFADFRLLFFGVALTVLATWRPEGLLPPRRTRRAKAVAAEIEALEEGEPGPRAWRRSPAMSESYASYDAPKALLEVDQVTLKFGGLTALNDVDFNINQGEILGLIGPNGAGKTTCFNVMTGVYRPTSGQVRLDGTALTTMKRHKITKLGLARTFQNIRLFKTMTVLENVMVGTDAHSKVGFWDALLRTPRHRRTESASRERAIEFARNSSASRPGTTSSPPTCPTATSGASRSPVPWAPVRSLLCLDEPAAGFNPAEKVKAHGA